MKPNLPANESERLAELYALEILDTPPEAAFDELTRLAAYICQTPMALVTLIDAERQWYKSSVGLEGTGTSRDASFCAHAILEPDEILVVPDALKDARFAENPAVTFDPHIRFYAGVPLVTVSGAALGTLCVIDRTPRQLTSEQLTALGYLSHQVTTQLALRHNQIKLQRSNLELRRLALVAQKTQNAVVVTDAQGVTQWVNNGFTRITGYAPAEIIGKKPGQLLQGKETDLETVERMRQAIKQISQFEGEIYNYAKNGKGYWLSISVTPIFDENEVHQGFIAIEMDITERKNTAAQLEKAHDAALESARLKSEFLANMSHEIRTPMNGIIGMTDLLLDTKLDDEQIDFAETIQSSANSLLTIINDILDFSKIEAGKLTFEIIDFDLRHTVKSTVGLLAEKARTKNVKLILQIDERVSLALRGDPGRLRQILLNLIGNAIKFTDQGKVVVRVESLSETETSAAIRFSVIDSGIGISAAAQKKLFQAFIQADGSTTRKYGGTGLGLAISKQLVAQMDGEIGVISEMGEGSTFWFTVTLEKQTCAQILAVTDLPAKINQPQPETIRLSNKRILLAEDNAVNQKLALRQLQKLGYTADAVSDGRKAVAAAAQVDYDLILMDCQMPEMDGYAATAEIRRREAESGRHTPIMAMTAHALTGDRERCLAAGMDEYLSKPINLDEFKRILKCWLETPAEKVEPPIDFERIRVMMGEDLTEIREILDIYLSDMEKSLVKLQNAVAVENFAEINLIGHNCAGVSANCGITALVAPFRQLEQTAGDKDLHGAIKLMTQINQRFECTKTFIDANFNAAAK